VLIVHGSGGVTNDDYRWAQFFNRLGIAALVIDSFSQRGHTTSTSGATQTIDTNAMIADAFIALKLLATHPLIDQNKVAIIGFSKGGEVSSRTAYEVYRTALINSDLKFSLHFSFYGGCSKVSTNTDGSPTYFFIGDQDYFYNTETCIDIVKILSDSGIDSKATIYNNVHHGFDTNDKQIVTISTFTLKDCNYIHFLDSNTFIQLDTSTIRPSSELKSYINTCATVRPVTFAGNISALSNTKEQIKSLFKQYYGISIDELYSVSEEQRILNWAESVYSDLLNGRTHIMKSSGYTYRCYSSSGYCIGFKDGKTFVYDGSSIYEAGPLTSFLDTATAIGF